MLRYLRIRNLAVIEQVQVEFEPGLNVLTGETGAGKSILVEAVGLLLGGRASSDLVRTGADLAQVEAQFDDGDDGGRASAGGDRRRGAVVPSSMARWYGWRAARRRRSAWSNCTASTSTRSSWTLRAT